MTQQKAAKQPYSAPRLKVYGTLTQLTNAVANNSTKADGGTMSMQKTA
jgi:hypothetical protein